MPFWNGCYLLRLLSTLKGCSSRLGLGANGYDYYLYSQELLPFLGLGTTRYDYSLRSCCCSLGLGITRYDYLYSQRLLLV